MDPGERRIPLNRTYGTANTSQLGTMLLVAFVIGAAVCMIRYAMDMLLTLGAGSRKQGSVPRSTERYAETEAEAREQRPRQAETAKTEIS